jgi:His-Xaa-Ser system protein HxsD
VVVRFQSAIYSLDAVKKAAYRLSDRLICEIASDGAETVCSLRPRSDASAGELQRLVDSFKLEILDQDLRQSIAAETEPLRNAILAYALSRADLPRE